jgi:hypothetical protein
MTNPQFSFSFMLASPLQRSRFLLPIQVDWEGEFTNVRTWFYLDIFPVSCWGSAILAVLNDEPVTTLTAKISPDPLEEYTEAQAALR